VNKGSTVGAGAEVTSESTWNSQQVVMLDFDDVWLVLSFAPRTDLSVDQLAIVLSQSQCFK